MDDLQKLLENAGLRGEVGEENLRNVTLKYNIKASGWDVFMGSRNSGFVYKLESGEYGAETNDGIGWDGIDTIEDAILALIVN